jgi:Ca-activated chloride channel family protein
MDSFRFDTPWALALLALLPLVAAVMWPRGASGAMPFGSVGAGARVRPTWRVRLEPWLMALRLLAVGALVVALARPQRGEAATDIEREGIDIVLAYDVSSSMTQPFAGRQTRLEVAEDVLRDFVESRTNDRLGLVAFQGSSITLSPLTIDYTALSDMVVTAGRLQLTDGTAIGTALGESVNVLRGSTNPSRIVILMTDGENNAGEVEPLAAARIAERLGVRVYTVGVVSSAAFPVRGNPEVDEEALKRMAEVTGGTYSRADNPQTLTDTYAGIEELEKARFESETFTRFDEIAPWFLAAAALVLALEVAMRSTVFRRAV